MFIGRSCHHVCACLSFGVQVSGVQGSDISKRFSLNFRPPQPRRLQYFPKSIWVKRHSRATGAISDPRLEETSEPMDAADQCSDMDEPWTAEEIQGFHFLERIIDAKDTRPVSRKLLEKVIFSQSSSIEEREAGKVLGILLRHNTHPIDEYFLKIAVQMGGGEGVRCLLSYYTNFIISEDIMLEAAKSTSVLKVLLSQEKHVEVTAQVIEAVLSQQQPDPGTIKLLLERSGELAIAEDIFVVAAEGDCKGAPITQILLDYQETVITQRPVEGALRNRNHTLDVLYVFLSHGRKAPLHQEVTDAAYTAHENNSEVMEILADLGYSIPTKNPTPQLKLEEGAFLPTPKTQVCPTCYNLSQNAWFTWAELRSSGEAGCRFCCVVRDGVTQIMGPIVDETHLSTSLGGASTRDFQLWLDQYGAPIKSVFFYMNEGMCD
jgi:hypothetical protein